MKFRLMHEISPEGRETFFTQTYADGRWSYVPESLYLTKEPAEAFFKDACKNGPKTTVRTMLAEVDTTDTNPLRKITRTLELDVEVSYRVEQGLPDELPNVYDITIGAVVDGKYMPALLHALEAELIVEEAEAAESRAQDRYLEREGREYSPEDELDRREAREARLTP